MNWLRHWFDRKSLVRKSRKPRHGTIRPQLESLEARQVPTVNFYGGNVLPNVEAQALFLGNQWGASANAPQTTTVNNFLTNLTGSAYMDALTRAGYGVGRGSASTGAVDNSALAANSTITDASIRSSIQSDIKNGSLKAPDANRLYIVYVEPNVAVNLGGGQGTTKQGILGYHGAFAGTDAAGHSTAIRYAVIAYPGGSVGNSSMGNSAIDQLTAVTSHELAEAVTDPDVNYSRLGWYDPQRGEIGDITENNPNALVRLNGYLVQEVADRNDQLLPITVTTPPPAPTPSTNIATTTKLSSSSSSHDIFGFPTVTLTFTVVPGSGSVAPSGTVQLIYRGSVLATGKIQVVNGVATVSFTIEFFATGSYDFTAQYLGSGQFQGSSSSTVNVRVS